MTGTLGVDVCGGAGCLATMDLVEVNPLLAPTGKSDQTVDMAVGLIASALGNRII